MQELFVDTPEQLSTLCQQLAGSEWIALDTEFIREKTYYPRLCLIQVCNGEVAACIDPIVLTDLQPLREVLYDGRILKVLHAARQDLEIFLNDWQQIPLPLFDTQPAAALLGHGDQVGYANLVKAILDVDLAKDQSRTDWARRPLDQQQIRYALDDVIYLGQAYLAMRAKLSDRARLQWLAADFADLADPASYYPDPRLMWRRIKGRQHLRGRQLAVLQAIAAWREEQARTRDLPRKWVIKDEVLIDLARRMPEGIEDMSRIRGLEPAQIRREGERLLELIAQAGKLPREEWPVDRARAEPLNANQDAMVDLLSAALRLIAEAHQLSPVAIATHKELANLARGDDHCALDEGWRKAVAGEPLRRLLRGELQLRIEDGVLVMAAPA